jgi:hypothetical protein
MGEHNTRKTGFGKRGREKAEPAERKATAAQRLKAMGSRWWRASGLQMKKDPPTKGFKRAKPRP